MAEPETFTLPPEDRGAYAESRQVPPDSLSLLNTFAEEPEVGSEYVPEPYTLLMIGSGLVAIGLVRRRGR
ncbi:MAG: PEP-CTERM sorting domain-containing protein [Bryobacteraceae bacterium]|nr:PEP-CTERM sorting domain-containing protein [Bryobacteraceae bacterium]